MVRIESNCDIVFDTGRRLVSNGVPELEHPFDIPENLKLEIGDNLVCLLGMRGSGKTTLAREMGRLKKSLLVPIRVTRPLRKDEKLYQEATGITEVIPMSFEEFSQTLDFFSVRYFSSTYYGVCLEDLQRVNEQRKLIGRKQTKMLLASGGMRDVIKLRTIFPSLLAVYLAVDAHTRQERMDMQDRLFTEGYEMSSK